MEEVKKLLFTQISTKKMEMIKNRCITRVKSEQQHQYQCLQNMNQNPKKTKCIKKVEHRRPRKLKKSISTHFNQSKSRISNVYNRKVSHKLFNGIKESKLSEIHQKKKKRLETEIAGKGSKKGVHHNLYQNIKFFTPRSIAKNKRNQSNNSKVCKSQFKEKKWGNQSLRHQLRSERKEYQREDDYSMEDSESETLDTNDMIRFTKAMDNRTFSKKMSNKQYLRVKRGSMINNKATDLKKTSILDIVSDKFIFKTMEPKIRKDGGR